MKIDADLIGISVWTASSGNASAREESERTPSSRRVDEGIHVSSLEARLMAASRSEHLRALRVKTWILVVLGVFFASMLLVSFTRAWKTGRMRPRWVVLAGMGLGFTILTGITLGKMTWHTCYIMWHFHWWLSRERIPACEALLEKYRTCGTIREETYEKLRRAFDEEKAEFLRNR